MGLLEASQRRRNRQAGGGSNRREHHLCGHRGEHSRSLWGGGQQPLQILWQRLHSDSRGAADRHKVGHQGGKRHGIDRKKLPPDHLADPAGCH